MQSIIKIKKMLIKFLEFFVIATLAILVLDVLWGVFTRYLIGNQSSWTEELARVLLIWVSLLGASLAFAQKSHLGVDYVISKMHPEAGKFMAVVANLIVMAFSLFILLIGGGQLVSRTFEFQQMLPAMNIPKGFVYLVVPVSGVFTMLFSLENIIEVFQKTKEQPTETHSEEVMTGVD